MEIQKYLEQINSLEKSELFQNIDLENCVLAIISAENKIEFKLEDAFENEILNKSLLSKIEQTLKLIFIKESHENVCFANSDDVRPEYKQSFTEMDLLDYICAFVHSSVYGETKSIVIVSETGFFWKLVKKGADLRKNEI
ncbi:hypothetical protein [Flavobacterium gelatinilyticum]|uniref:hypothetical protein n=1 Tax=Flavobacterium gelatinilyticum TaxID=3003260 RepID=UPI002480822C|nr:hypothetical protein [Flavobacterium gelatinilyticum]